MLQKPDAKRMTLGFMNFRHQVVEERDSVGALKGSPKPTKDASGESTPADITT